LKSYLFVIESFIDVRGPIHDQMIPDKMEQKMIVIIRAIKFKALIGSAIRSEEMGPFSAENTYFSIENISIPPFSNRMAN